MKVEVVHQLDPAEALKRVKALTAYWSAKHGVEVRWSRRTARLRGTFLGISQEATLEVSLGVIVAEGPDPGILLRHAAAAYVTSKIDRYLRGDFGAVEHRPGGSVPAAA